MLVNFSPNWSNKSRFWEAELWLYLMILVAVWTYGCICQESINSKHGCCFSVHQMQSACLKAEWNRIDDCVPKIYLKVIHYLPWLWKTRGKTQTPTQLTTDPQAQLILLISSYRRRYRCSHLVDAYWQFCNTVYFILLTAVYTAQRWTLFFLFFFFAFISTSLLCFVWLPDCLRWVSRTCVSW